MENILEYIKDMSDSNDWTITILHEKISYSFLPNCNIERIGCLSEDTIIGINMKAHHFNKNIFEKEISRIKNYLKDKKINTLILELIDFTDDIDLNIKLNDFSEKFILALSNKEEYNINPIIKGYTFVHNTNFSNTEEIIKLIKYDIDRSSK